MKSTRFIGTWLPLVSLCSFSFVSCADLGKSHAPHDMDGDGAISHADYQRSLLQYNLASRQRVDEYSRTRHATNHADSIPDFVGGVSGLTDFRTTFGNGKSTKIVPDADEPKPSVRNPGSKPKAVPDPKELKTPAKDL